MSLTGCQSFSLSGGHFVDAALFVDEAALNHFEVQVTRHLCDQQHTDQLTYECEKDTIIILCILEAWQKIAKQQDKCDWGIQQRLAQSDPEHAAYLAEITDSKKWRLKCKYKV